MASKPLTDAEVTAIKGCLKTPEEVALFVLGIRTGFRISELLSLTWNDVGPDTVTVRRANMKGKHASRTVPLHPEAKEALNLLRGITCGDKPFTLNRFQYHRRLKAATKAAGVVGRVSSHSMRKTLAQRVYIKSGKDLIATQRALGHKSPVATQHYLSIGQDVVDQLILSV